MARVILRRDPKPFKDVLKPYNVLIDGKVVGSIRRRQTQSFDIPAAGYHEMHLTIGKYSSVTKTLNQLAPGQEVRLVCRASPYAQMNFGKPFSPNSYIELKLDEPSPGAPP